MIEKLEKLGESFLTNLEEKPFKTIVKTIILIWLINKVIKLVK